MNGEEVTSAVCLECNALCSAVLFGAGDVLAVKIECPNGHEWTGPVDYYKARQAGEYPNLTERLRRAQA